MKGGGEELKANPNPNKLTNLIASYTKMYPERRVGWQDVDAKKNLLKIDETFTTGVGESTPGHTVISTVADDMASKGMGKKHILYRVIKKIINEESREEFQESKEKFIKLLPELDDEDNKGPLLKMLKQMEPITIYGNGDNIKFLQGEHFPSATGGGRRRRRRTRKKRKGRKARKSRKSGKKKKTRGRRRKNRRRTRKKKGGTHDYKSVENDNKEMVADAFNQKNLGKSYQEF